MTEAVALTRAEGMADNRAPNGRKFKIHPKANTSLLCIAAEDKQVVPSELDGMYTDPVRAQLAIEKYLKAAWDYNDEQVLRQKRKDTAAPKDPEPESELLSEDEIPTKPKRGRNAKKSD